MQTHSPLRRYPSLEMPYILPVREQALVIERILRTRLACILPRLMREEGIDMWLVICNEDNHDPIFNTLIPMDTWAPITQILAFCLNADDSVDCINISLTKLKGIYQDIWSLSNPDDQWACLKKLVKERNPKTIGINESADIWAADGLTSILKQKLVTTLGARYTSRLKSAERLGVRWLETLIDEEIELYERTAAISHTIIAEAYSPAVLTPGVTTTEDLQWYYWQRAVDLGLTYSFTPFFGLQRSEEMKQRYDPADRIIRQGDVLHCDVGVIYLRLYSDHQEMAYVLRGGESQAPQGLTDTLHMGNRLQDILLGEMKPGLSGNEILNAALARAHEEGLSNPRIYTHSIGYFLHEPGPLIGLPWEQKDTDARGNVKLEYNTCFSIELGVTCAIPEWNDQSVRFSIEQDAVFTDHGIYYFDGRQTELHLIG